METDNGTSNLDDAERIAYTCTAEGALRHY
jgi:hypothetical protein